MWTAGRSASATPLACPEPVSPCTSRPSCVVAAAAWAWPGSVAEAARATPSFCAFRAEPGVSSGTLRVVSSPSSRTALGELIRRQRELAALPVRQFAAMVGISGPYLSQIERGLRAPSDNVLRAIAESLQTTADALYADAGYTVVEESEGDDAPARVAAALEQDPELTASQRRALLEAYAAFRDANVVRRRRAAEAEEADAAAE